MGSGFEDRCGSVQETGVEPTVGKQNKDLLLGKDQGGLGVLLACVAHSCWCPEGESSWPGPRNELSHSTGWPLLGVWLSAVALGEGIE